MEYLVKQPLGTKEGILLSWAGVRGVVTLAAAQTLPFGASHRSLLILIAFAMAGGSLVVQGGTIPLAIRWLGLSGHDTVPPEERAHLDAELREAALAVLRDPALHQPDGQPYSSTLVESTAARLAALPGLLPDHQSADGTPANVPAEPANGSPRDETAPTITPDVARQFHHLRLACIHAEREALLAARSTRGYSSQTLSGALAELDADEMSLELRLENR